MSQTTVFDNFNSGVLVKGQLSSLDLWVCRNYKTAILGLVIVGIIGLVVGIWLSTGTDNQWLKAFWIFIACSGGLMILGACVIFWNYYDNKDRCKEVLQRQKNVPSELQNISLQNLL